jgi:two-component system, LuxR family, response regulator FixJ
MELEQQIFIVDDDKNSRDSVAALVGTMNLATQRFASAEDFLNVFFGQPGCLVCDYRLPGLSGTELLANLMERDLMIPTVVVSAFAEVPVAVEAMQRGAIAMLEKPYLENDMWNLVRTALRLDAGRRNERVERHRVRALIECLTNEERLVMDSIVDGLTNKTIAFRLDSSLRTVETRRRSVYDKLNVDCVAQLVKLVVANGSPPL